MVYLPMRESSIAFLIAARWVACCAVWCTFLSACDANFIDDRGQTGDLSLSSIDGDGGPIDDGGVTTLIGEGPFSGMNGFKTTGTAKLSEVSGEVQLQLDSDFSVSAAPDTIVVLSTRAALTATLDAEDVEVGPLSQLVGRQTYLLAADSGRRNVFVYSNALGIPLGRATLISP